MSDLLGIDERGVQDDTLYRCLDLLLPQKEERFQQLRKRWSDLFRAPYEVLLYDPGKLRDEGPTRDGLLQKLGGA